jgi:phosphomannomutase
VGDDTPAPAYGTSYSIHGARDEYRRWLLEVIDLGKVREKGLSVGVDAGCATAAGLVSDALRGAWCRVHALNDEPGPDPGRGPEPRESSLTALSELVVEKGLDMGVAFDADADRVSFIDERGRYVSEDAAGAILGAHVLPGKGGVMVTPVNSSGMAGHLAQSRSADLYHCRIGQPAISSEVKARGAHFAYEESGKYFFTNHTLAADGPLACFMMLEALATTGESLSALVEHLPVFHQVKHNLTLPGEGLDVFMETISSRWNEWEPYSGMTRDVTDGLKLTLGDG